MSISVCMATYNGEKYIEIQLKSIINQLSENDEIIIVDDCSTDDTVKMIKLINDYRIKIYFNKINRGHVFSFGRAISLANNDVIFMSDQDDIWLDGRVSIMNKELMKKNTLLVSTNTNFINFQGNIIEYKVDELQSIDSNKNFGNIIGIFTGKAGYYGCAMVFKKELKEIILPIPKYVESHDLWIALAANLLKSNSHCDANTLSRRVHSNNASIVSRNVFLKLGSRIIFVISIFQLVFRKIKIKIKKNE